MKIDGGCHCRYIGYEAEVDPDGVMICHCTDCQTLSGSAFRTVVPAREGSFKLRSGELKIYVKTGESGRQRAQSFCPECGTPISSSSTSAEPKVHIIRVGTVRQRDRLVPKAQLWTRSAQRWVDGLGSMKRFEKELG
ncbi:MAG TPA: GFA family protein [Stellaceae bacterium]|nr:GFA family protein [Stellaceae bacterium]